MEWNERCRSERPLSAEHDIIAKYFAPIANGEPGALGLLDDAAVLTPTANKDLVTTVDTLIEGVHFFKSDPPFSIAAKSLSVNLSDLAAKGATPTVYNLSLALPDEAMTTREVWLKGFSEGLKATQETYNCTLIGGDTIATPGPLTITITALGEVPRGRMIKRQGAKLDDRIFVSGTIGDSALGLELRRDAAFADKCGLNDEQEHHLKERYLHPLPRVALAPALLEYATSAMDISDGLVGDLEKLLAQSRVGAEVQLENIPLSNAARTVQNASPAHRKTILTGGDDYEILATIPPENVHSFTQSANRAGLSVSDIGHIVCQERGARFLDTDSEESNYDISSYSHF